MECPICREDENGRWICSGGPNGGGDLDNTLDGAGHGYIVDVMPLTCIRDSLDELAELQMMSESDYYYSGPLSVDTSIPPSAGVLPLDAPFLLCPHPDDLLVQDDILEYFLQQYPDLHGTVMTIQQVSVGSETADETSAGESTRAAQSSTSEGGWGDSLD